MSPPENLILIARKRGSRRLWPRGRVLPFCLCEGDQMRGGEKREKEKIFLFFFFFFFFLKVENFFFLMFLSLLRQCLQVPSHQSPQFTPTTTATMLGAQPTAHTLPRGTSSRPLGSPSSPSPTPERKSQTPAARFGSPSSWILAPTLTHLTP